MRVLVRREEPREGRVRTNREPCVFCGVDRLSHGDVCANYPRVRDMDRDSRRMDRDSRRLCAGTLRFAADALYADLVAENTAAQYAPRWLRDLADRIERGDEW